MAAGSQILTICLCRDESVEDPQKKTRMSGVQLAASQASSFERFSQMKSKKQIANRKKGYVEVA